uniref:FLYWCH-type domain-containing protein n=1 Tax=Glossina austeni TaxID=7395 RepID=A0A1A9VHY4_GLOAU
MYLQLQAFISGGSILKYIYSQRGHPLIVLNNYLYRKNRGKYWRCLVSYKYGCKASLVVDATEVKVMGKHNHVEDLRKISQYRKIGLPAQQSLRATKTKEELKTIIALRDHYRELLKKPEAYSLPFPIGVWLENPTLYFMLNQKQGYNLIFHGYMYKKEASFRSTVNWICSNGNGKRASDNKCTARCITKMEGSLKLGKNPHNHPPKFTQNSLPANLLKAEGLLPILKTYYDELLITDAQTLIAKTPIKPVTRTAALSSSDSQGPIFVVSKYGTKQLVLKQHTFNRHVSREDVTYWRCSQFAVLRCRARIKTKGNILTILNCEHNHEVITKARKYGSLKNMKMEAAQQNIKTETNEVAPTSASQE